MRIGSKYQTNRNAGIRIIPFAEFNKIENFVKWINAFRVKNHDKRKFPSRIIKIDFKRCKFLKPYHIVPLACIIYEFEIKNFRVKLINLSEELEEYLKSFRFDQFCKEINENELVLPSDSKTFPLWRIEQSGIDLYPQKVQEYFEKLHFKGRSLFSLSMSQAELMNNVFDHSESKIPGFTFTQYNTRNNTITTCVCDFGIGIPTKVNKYLKDIGEETLDNKQALLKALELSFSTKSKPHNRGFGLDNISAIIKELKSRLLIVSNDVIYNINNDGRVINKIINEKFPGTLVVIYLNASELPNNEEELEDELSII